MFNRKKQPPIKSLIAHGSQINGNYIFSEGLRVDGGVTGNIRSSDEQPSILVVSETGGDGRNTRRPHHRQWSGERAGVCQRDAGVAAQSPHRR